MAMKVFWDVSVIDVGAWMQRVADRKACSRAKYSGGKLVEVVVSFE